MDRSSLLRRATPPLALESSPTYGCIPFFTLNPCTLAQVSSKHRSSSRVPHIQTSIPNKGSTSHHQAAAATAAATSARTPPPLPPLLPPSAPARCCWRLKAAAPSTSSVRPKANARPSHPARTSVGVWGGQREARVCTLALMLPAGLQAGRGRGGASGDSSGGAKVRQ